MADGIGEYPPRRPTARLAAVLPPRTRASPRFFSLLLLPAVLPKATSCMNLSTSSVVTAATLSWPSRGLIWRSMRPLSISSVLRFLRLLAARQHTPSLGVGEIKSHNYELRSAASPLGLLHGRRILPFLTCPSRRCASARAVSGVRANHAGRSLPPLSAFQSPIEKYVGSDRAPLAPRTKAGDRSVPGNLTWF